MCLEDTVRIPLRARDGSVRAYALVDAADADAVNRWRWCLQANGYAVRGTDVNGRHRSVLLHREILGLLYGDSREVDHINRNKLDNRRSNLRVVNRLEQMQNIPNRTGGTSSYRGVFWDKRKRYWRAEIQIRGKHLFCGYFVDEEDAAQAARRARASLMSHATD